MLKLIIIAGCSIYLFISLAKTIQRLLLADKIELTAPYLSLPPAIQGRTAATDTAPTQNIATP